METKILVAVDREQNKLWFDKEIVTVPADCVVKLDGVPSNPGDVSGLLKGDRVQLFTTEGRLTYVKALRRNELPNAAAAPLPPAEPFSEPIPAGAVPPEDPEPELTAELKDLADEDQ